MSADMPPARDEALYLYRLLPVALPGDPRWDNAPGHGEVLVCARSAADARIVASEAEEDFLEEPARPGDGNSTRFASTFRDEKLYQVVEVEETSSHHPLSRGVVEGDLARPVIRPNQG